MLGLKMATDPRWVKIVEKNIEEILVDHAYCEQKAASNAISMIVQYPQYPDLVAAMSAICKEEMEHNSKDHHTLAASFPNIEKEVVKVNENKRKDVEAYTRTRLQK